MKPTTFSSCRRKAPIGLPSARTGYPPIIECEIPPELKALVQHLAALRAVTRRLAGPAATERRPLRVLSA